MKIGVAVSSVGHAAILTFALVSLPSPEEFDTSSFESLPVEVFSVEEVTNLRKGEVDAPETPEPEPVPVETPEAEAEPEAAEQEEVTALLPDPVEPEPEPEITPEPAPEPEPVAEPVPEPEPVEQAESEPTPEPAPEAEPAPEIAETPIRLPAARPKNIPQRPRETAEEKPKEKSFNPDDIAALLNKEETENKEQSEGEGAGGQQASLGARTGEQSALSQSELDYLRGQIAGCWSPPIGVANPEDLIVRVQINLNQDGSLAGAEILQFKANSAGKAAADSALRAVRRCQPFTLPAAKYDTWRTVNIRFDPRDMLN